ncbi:MAG: serine/threonine-protein kinase [Chthoniobacteraceae bacterium]
MGLTTRNYDIITRFAVGNGALVYRATDKVTHRQVALKLLVQDGNVDHRFQAEPLLADAPRLRQITGAHVCQLLDAIADDDGPVLVYEFAQGTSGAELASKKALDAAQVIDVAAQLISALRSGERQKTPHGDVKPSNLIFMELPGGRPFALVLDWALTAYRSIVADDTLPFLAPERLGGAAASHRADLFSAGATLFQLCTGKMLIAAKTRTEAEAAWQTVEVAVLAELRPDLPPKFVQWLCSLLELSPEKRPESAVAALVTLAALNPPPPPVPPESFRPRPVLPSASGIVKAPPSDSKVKPVSAIRRPPPASGTSSAAAKPATKIAAAPAKKSHVAATLGLFAVLITMIAGVVWFFFFRTVEETRYPGDTGDPLTRPATAAARAPAPSVGKDIGKPSARPPAAPPTAKAAQNSAQPDAGKRPKPKPKRNPPTPDSPAPQPAAK